MSKFDSLIDQIAFGIEAPKASTSLGLYLGPDVIYLSETHLSGGKLVVDHMVRIPIPVENKNPAGGPASGPTAGPTATMNTDFLADPAKIAGLIRQSMAQMRWNSRGVRVTLSHHVGLLRYFAMPAVDRRFLRSAVPIEAKKYIPIPFDALAYDYQAAPLPADASGRQRLGVLIAVTQKKNIANVMGLIEALRLKLLGIEVAPCSVLRMWQKADPQRDRSPFAHVHIDGGSVRIMVVDRGAPVFFREVFLGSDATLADMRKIDLSGCLSFVQKQLGLGGVSRLRISGGLANLAALKDAFVQETSLPAEIQDMPKLLSVKSGDWGGYASLGASAGSLDVSSAPLDLAAVDRVTDEERRTARAVIVAGVLGAIFFVAAGLLKSASYTFRVQELHQYQRKLDPEAATALKGMAPSEVETMLRDMQAQLEQLHAVTVGGRHLKISALLKAIIETMPDKLWFENIRISDVLLSDQQALPFSIVLSGHVQDRTVADEQAIAFQFKDALIRKPEIGKAFEVSIAVQTKKGDNTTPAGLDPKSLAGQMDNRTEFELNLKAKN